MRPEPIREMAPPGVVVAVDRDVAARPAVIGLT